MSTFAYLCIILCLVGSITSLISTRSFVNPVIPMFFPWLFVIINSATLINLQRASNYTYFLIFLGLICYFCGVLLVRYINITPNHTTIDISCRSLRKKVVYFLIFVSIIVYLRNIVILGIGNIANYQSTIGSLQNGLDLGYSGILAPIIYYVVNPCKYAIPAVVLTEYVFLEKDNRLLFATIVMMLLSSIQSGSKSLLLLIILFAIVAILMNNSRKVSIKGIIILITLTFIGIVLYVVLTNARGQLSNSLGLYELGISPRMFEIWRQVVANTGLKGYGEASFIGFIYPFAHMLFSIFGDSPFTHIRNIYTLIQNTDSVWVNPGQYIKANAYVSIFWFFYLDFRVVGIIIGSFITGMVSNIMFKLSLITRDKLFISMYIVIFYQLLFSIIRFGFANEEGALTFIYILLLWGKNKVSRRSI